MPVQPGRDLGQLFVYQCAHGVGDWPGIQLWLKHIEQIGDGLCRGQAVFSGRLSDGVGGGRRIGEMETRQCREFRVLVKDFGGLAPGAVENDPVIELAYV